MKNRRLTGILLAVMIAFTGSLAAQDMENIGTKATPKQETTKTAIPKQEPARTTTPKQETLKSTIQKGKDVVIIETNMGTIEVSLFRADAPKTVENFEGLAKKGYYNEVVEAIGKVETTKPGDKPVKTVVMNRVYLKGGKDKTAKGPDDKK